MKTEVVIDRTNGNTGRINRINVYVDGVRVKTIMIFGNEAHIYNGDSSWDRHDKPVQKSAACSHVLRLMDADIDYQTALNEALLAYPVSVHDLERELNLYI